MLLEYAREKHSRGDNKVVHVKATERLEVRRIQLKMKLRQSTISCK